MSLVPIEAADNLAREPRLFRTALRIEPSLRQIATMAQPAAKWHLTAEQMTRLDSFTENGFAAAVRGRMAALPGAQEFVITPDAGLLVRLNPDQRLRWWGELARHPENVTYRWPVAIREEVLAELAGVTGFAEATARVRRWGVVSFGRVLFADLFALEGAFANESVRQAFLQRFFGADMAFAKLVINSTEPAKAAAYASYWLGGGRSRALEPVLTAIARIEGHDRVDLVHLLPRLARSLLYTYPPDFRVEWEPAVDNAVLAAGFFDPDIDPRPVLSQGFGAWLQTHCDRVEEGRQFGDIVVFEDPETERWPYAMINLADGILLGRRPAVHGPWELVEEEEIAKLNPRLAGRSVTVFRPRMPATPRPGTTGSLPPGWLKAADLQDLPAGPWGRLKAYDVLLAPSTELLENLAVPAEQPRWTFRGVSVAEIDHAIQDVPMPAGTRAELAALFSGALPAADGAITVHPSPELVLAVPAGFRERLFEHLEHGLMAEDYAQLVSLPTQLDAPEWFDPEALPPRAREIVLKLAYRRQGSLALSDFGVLYHAIPDPAERVAALRALYRSPALVVLLERPKIDEVPAMVKYWRQDQPVSLGRLLTSFAETEDMRYLDLAHLLPPLARELQNVYIAAATDLPAPSCYWTAFNFMAERPDSRLLVNAGHRGNQDQLAWQKLRDDYEPLGVTMPTLGDIVVYRRDSDGFMLHVCSYVAADVVYTKNGLGLSNPWCLMRLKDVDALYLRGGGVTRLVFRLADVASTRP